MYYHLNCRKKTAFIKAKQKKGAEEQKKQPERRYKRKQKNMQNLASSVTSYVNHVLLGSSITTNIDDTNINPAGSESDIAFKTIAAAVEEGKVTLLDVVAALEPYLSTRYIVDE